MKKILGLITFAAGAVFALFFSSKKGEELRHELRSKRTSDEKMEMLAKETKSLFRNFWSVVKNPLRRGLQVIEKDAKKYGGEFGSKALKEIKKDVKMVSKKVKSTAMKAAKSAKKKVMKMEVELKRKMKRKAA